MPALKDFSLVGGTALALKFGHRISIDLDLFSNNLFDNTIIIKALEQEFAADFVLQVSRENFGVFGFIENIKIDIVKFPHPVIGDIETIDGIRMYSNEDIMAMKISAILGRGKKKDFWDIAELLNHYSIDDFINSYFKKYPEQRLLISIPYALTYFADAEESETPVSLKGQTWEKVKKNIEKKVREYLK